MANLAHDDVARREGRLLRVVARERELLARVRDVVRGDRRVVRDLLYGEVRLSAPVVVRPVAEEESEVRELGVIGGRGDEKDVLAEDGVQRPVRRGIK